MRIQLGKKEKLFYPSKKTLLIAFAEKARQNFVSQVSFAQVEIAKYFLPQFCFAADRKQFKTDLSVRVVNLKCELLYLFVNVIK